MKNKEETPMDTFVRKSKNMAFPLMVDDGGQYAAACGLTKLEYFTAKAMEGFCANPEFSRELGFEEIHNEALKVAKATLEALSNEE